MKYGAKMIAKSTLEAVPNPNPERDYEIDLSIPEFTCLCPRSNFPDFATIRIHYVPDQSIVELKSLKLYINQFRDQELFHEQAVNRILDDLVALNQPPLSDKSTLLKLYREMLLIRRFEEKTAEMYQMAKIGGFCHLNIGEEATIVGTVSALRKEDYVYSNYREHGHAIAKGVDAKAIMAE